MMRRTMIVAALAAAVLAACGNVTDSVQFNVPPEYHSKANIGPFAQVWESPDRKSVMLLAAIPAPIDIDKALKNADVSNTKPHENERITICGNQPANYVEETGTTGTDIKVGINEGQSTKTNSNIHMLTTTANGKTYIALYAYPLHAKPDPQADSALRGVCAK